ncbi:hypothetical protein ACOME3_006869 [Neoechinorhynchus agilis]
MSSTRTITREKVNEYREYRFAESSEARKRHPVQRPVEIRFSKPQLPQRTEAEMYKRFRSVDRFDTRSTKSGLSKSDERKTRLIRLSSVPPTEPNRKCTRVEPSFAPIDIIVGKPITHTIVRDEFTLSKDRRDLVIGESEVEVRLPKARHASTVVRQKEDKSKISSYFEMEGEKSVLKLIEEPIGQDGEVVLNLPKGQHSSTVRRHQKAKDEVFQIDRRQRITGEREIMHIEKPIQLEEEIDVRLEKEKGSHAATIYKEIPSRQERYHLHPKRPIPGEHDVYMVDETVKAQESLDVQLPKIERQVAEHSSTVLRSKQEKEQVMTLKNKLVLPGEHSYKHVRDRVQYLESEDVVLPKQGQHSSTVYKQTHGPIESYNIGTVRSDDDQRILKKISNTELEVRVPKPGDHSSTLVCDGTQRVDLGKLRTTSGTSSILYVSDEIEDHRSTVVMGAEKNLRVDVALESEFSEYDENVDREYRSKRDHKTTLMADLEGDKVEHVRQTSHSTTTVKNVAEKMDRIEMVIDRPLDTSEVTARIEAQTEPQTIHLPAAQLYEQRQHQRAQSEVVARVGARYQIMSEAQAQEQSSISIEPIKRREETIDLRMGSSTTQIVANVKPRLQLLHDKIESVGSSSVQMDMAEISKASVNVLMPQVELQPSSSGVVVDLCGALSGPSTAVKGAEQFSSELILGPKRPPSTNAVELVVDEPAVETSSSRVVANLSSSLTRQSSVGMQHVPAEISTSTFVMDLTSRVARKDVNVNLGEIYVDESSSGITADIDTSLSVLDRTQYMTQQKNTSSVELPLTDRRPSVASEVDVRMKTDIRGRTEVLANLPDKVQNIKPFRRPMSSSKFEMIGHRPVEASVRIPKEDMNVSQFRAQLNEHGSSEIQLRDFGHQQPEVEVVLHPPIHSEQSSTLSDYRKYEASEGSATIIKQIGSLSPERYYVGARPEQNTSTVYIEMNEHNRFQERFNKDNRRFDFEEGGPIHLIVDAIDVANARWTKDGVVLGDRYSTFITDRSVELYVADSRHTDSGIYECSATDKHNRVTSHLFIVNVKSVSEKSEFQVFNNRSDESSIVRKRMAPLEDELCFVQELPSQLVCEVGEQLRLITRIKGNAIKTSWFHNEVLIKENLLETSQPNHIYDHSMVVPCIDKRYEGIYTVKVVGPFTSIESYCRVTVNGNHQLNTLPSQISETFQKPLTTFHQDVTRYAEQSVPSNLIEITTTKRRKPETTIKVREGDCNECVFVISETDDGEYVVTETTDDEHDHR